MPVSVNVKRLTAENRNRHSIRASIPFTVHRKYSYNKGTAMTLTETAIMTKKALLFGAIFFVVAIFAWGGYQFWYHQVYLPSRPVVEEKPDEKFGTLPKLFIKQNIADSKAFNYKLDTDTGGLPDKIPKLFKVYSIAQLATDLLALDRAKSLAGLIGFNRGSQAISATKYKFLDQNGGELSIKTLVISI
jgi:hypothetical protein